MNEIKNYRVLNPDEIILFGDEFLMRDGEWHITGDGNRGFTPAGQGYKYRRTIKGNFVVNEDGSINDK